MMYTAPEKLAIIRLVEESELFIRRTLREIKISRTSFYRWYRAYEERGLDGLENQSRAVRKHWNRIPDSVRELIVEVALERPDLTPRELAWHITDAHDYSVPYPGFYGGANGQGPGDVLRESVGRISFAHSELAGLQHYGPAADEGRRAFQQVAGLL